MEVDPQAALQEARAARRTGNYLRQLSAARDAASFEGPHREAALLEALEALVFLERFGEARGSVAALQALGGPRTRIRVAAWHSYIEVIEGHPLEARKVLDAVESLIEDHAEPHDVFLIHVARSRMEHACEQPLAAIEHAEPVSYTHLTLPTNREV